MTRRGLRPVTGGKHRGDGASHGVEVLGEAERSRAGYVRVLRELVSATGNETLHERGFAQLDRVFFR